MIRPISYEIGLHLISKVNGPPKAQFNQQDRIYPNIILWVLVTLVTEWFKIRGK